MTVTAIKTSIDQSSSDRFSDHQIEAWQRTAKDQMTSTARVIKMKPRSLLVGEEQAYLLMTHCNKGKDQSINSSPPKSIKRAIDLMTGEVRAVVVMKRPEGLDFATFQREYLDPFEKELEAHRSCSSIEGVAKLLLHCTTKDKKGNKKVMQVMEYCQGESPSWGFHRITSPNNLESLCSLLKIVRTIHQQGCFHGDLHPGNVILTQDGPRLIDFGLCEQQNPRLKDLGMICTYQLRPFCSGLQHLNNAKEIYSRMDQLIKKTEKTIEQLYKMPEEDLRQCKKITFIAA